MSGGAIIHEVMGHPWGVAPAPAIAWGIPLAAKEGSMTDRRDDGDAERRARRQAEEDHKRQQEDKEKRSDQLKESWRRNHPSEEDEKRPKRGRPA
jgi:hypothetical protein